MNFPVSKISSTGSSLTSLAEQIKKLAADAESINASIAGSYDHGGVGDIVGSIADAIKSQASLLNQYGGVATRASTIYEDTSANISTATVETIFGVATPLVTLLSTTIDSGNGDGLCGENAEGVSDDDSKKVKLEKNSSAVDVVTQVWEDKVDDYRKNIGRSGKKAKHENIVYSSSKIGTISILDANFKYEKYTDYIEGSLETVEGDGFYSLDAQVGKDCHHINFEATDGSGFSGEISAISAYAYGDSEFDLAKGNAYVKAGGGVSIVSAEVGSESEWGGAFLEVGIGAEASADVGIHNGTFTFDVTVPVFYGVTAGVDLEINYISLWNDFCDTFGF